MLLIRGESYAQEEEAEKVYKQIPLQPYLAKEHFGADFLINYGWNLSEADAEYGRGWLFSYG
jgi:hypothetical protein